MRYSTARSGLLNDARSAFITSSRSKPISHMLAIADWRASPATAVASHEKVKRATDQLHKPIHALNRVWNGRNEALDETPAGAEAAGASVPAAAGAEDALSAVGSDMLASAEAEGAEAAAGAGVEGAGVAGADDSATDEAAFGAGLAFYKTDI